MNELVQFGIGILGVLCLIALLAVVINVGKRNAVLAGLKPAANVAGTHQGGNLTRLAGAVIASSYLLGKKGASDDKVVICSVEGETSAGVITDEAEVIGDSVNLATHGGADGTRKVRAGDDIAVGDELTGLANAKAQKLPAAAGTYWIFGEALSAGADGDLVEYAPCKAQPRVVTE